MKKSCLLLTVLFFALWGGYVYILKLKVAPWAPAVILGFFGALGFVVIVSSLRQIVRSSRQKRAFRRAQEGEPFEDGKMAVAIGAIRPDSYPLVSPISGQECVAYEFDVFTEAEPLRKGSVQKEREVLYSGMALCPSSIGTLQGKIRLLGFPTLENISRKSLSGKNFEDAFKAYAERTSFQDMRGMKKLGTAISQLENVLVDDDGGIKQDWQLKTAPEIWDGVRYSEKLVGVGDKVVVIGRYSAEKRGLVNELGVGGMVNDLYPGAPSEVLRKIRGNARFLLAFGIGFFLISHAIMTLVWVGGIKK